MLALDVRGVTKEFGGVHALEGVDLDVRRGEVHALMGTNGSGKSTLVKILAGFHSPTAVDSAAVDERPFALGNPSAALSAGVRFVHQELGLVESLDSVDNIALARGFAIKRGKIDWKRERERARRLVQDLGYDVAVDVPVGELSASRRTAVAIARALDSSSGDIRLLVLDEPTAALSGQEADRLYEVVAGIRARGIGVIMVSHHIEEVMGIADRVTVLRSGKKVGTYDRASLDRRQLVELMTGHPFTEREGELRSSTGTAAISVKSMSGGAVDDVTLTIDQGEVVGVAGITGSGVDELALLMYGVIPWRRGTIEVAGKALPELSPLTAGRSGIGFVSGDRHKYGLVPTFTVGENITLPDLAPLVRRQRLNRKAERADTASWIQRLRITPAASAAAINSLSGGNQQKVQLAKVLRVAPKVLLLDDPTRGVDIAAKDEIHRLIERAVEAGAAVLLCSSDLEELTHLSDRVLVLRRGRIAHELARHEFDSSTLNQLTL